MLTGFWVVNNFVKNSFAPLYYIKRIENIIKRAVSYRTTCDMKERYNKHENMD